MVSSGVILEALKKRLCAALARPAPDRVALDAVCRHADALSGEGSWADVEYGPAAGRTRWPAVTHLERVVALARARMLRADELDTPFVRALDFWLARDFTAPDVWTHQIAVPRLIGTTALLGEAALSPGARGKVAEIVARARWTRWHEGDWTPWRGADLVAVAFNVLLRGCLEASTAECQEAFERAHAEMRIAPEDGEGIQTDLSFSPTDRHGLAFGEQGARFLALGHGTSWQAPAGCLQVFASFLLDGPQWMIRRRFFDAGLTHVNAVDLDGFAAAVEELAALGVTPRQAEMAAFARRLRGVAEPVLSGHRHFWRAGLAIHQRPAFYASVRTGADGLTRLLRRGDEYEGGDAWDRRRLPGTTALQVAEDPTGDTATGGRRGGVTDGEQGVDVLELHRGGMAGRKAWFHFDESLVCLGSGITCDRAAAPVFTSINQCWSREPATAYGKGGETHHLVPGKSYDLSAAHRLDHDGLVYHFPEPTAARAHVAPAAGGAAEIFSLWIDHGTQPRHEAYAYAVLPSAEAQGFSQVKILANTPAHQAVWHQGLRLIGIVFWEPGVLALPGGGRVAVNRPCVLLGQERRSEGTRLSIANPAHDAATIHVEYANRCLCFNLPAGSRGGPGVTRVL